MIKRALVLHPSNEWYGADQMLYAWIKVLRSEGWAVTAVLPTDVEYSGELASRLGLIGAEVRSRKIPVLRRRSLSPLGLLRLLMYLTSCWRELRSLAQSSDIVLLSTAAVLPAAIPTVKSGALRAIHLQEHVGQGAQGQILSGMIALLAREIVACSGAVREGLRGAARRRCTIVYNGIPDVTVKVGEPTEETASAPYILLVARIQRWKGQEMAIRVLAEPGLRDHPLRPSLRLIGSEPPGEVGVYLPPLRRLVEALELQGRVDFMGQRADIPKQIHNAAVVLNVSQQPDPFPLSALEGMRGSAPMVAGRLGGLPEMLADTGLLVDPRSPSAIAGAVTMILDSPALQSELGRRSRERWEAHFSEAAHEARLSVLFQAWASGRP